MSAAADDVSVPALSAGPWPFLLRQKELARARSFIEDAQAAAPRLLRILGDSGSGKSFLAKEIISTVAHSYAAGAVVHINVPPSDLEASEFLAQVERVLTSPGTSNYSGGGALAAGLRRKWRRRTGSGISGRREYFYNVIRELSGQIPIVGPFIKACLPVRLPAAASIGAEPLQALRFLLQQSHAHPTLMVIDNVQFLPTTVRELLEGEMTLAGKLFTLVIIERIREGGEFVWNQSFSGFVRCDIHLERVTVEEVQALVREQLPGEEHDAEMAEAIHRRSGGNLKSVWFQIRFVAARRASQGRFDDASYEAVVQSLTPIDQLVLRVVVILLGGLSIYQMLGIIRAMNLHITGEAVSAAISDLSALGLLVVNSRHHDRVKVEHEIVSQVVSHLTPEDEKLELQSQLVYALTALLERPEGVADANAAALYDRLIGIATQRDVRASAAIQAHIVRFIETAEAAENYTYLGTLLRDSVCWDTLDLLPSMTVRTLLNAAQKCSAFETGLLATHKLQASGVHLALSTLFEAKFLVQLFRYEEALQALNSAPPTPERTCIEFNIMINLCENESAVQLVRAALDASQAANPSEHHLVVLRNCAHLFEPREARRYLEAALAGFEKIGRRFGVATTINNLALVELAAGNVDTAREHLSAARVMLSEMRSSEVYQPLVNLSALEAAQGRWARADRFLAAAREAAPWSLAMDNLMFEYNQAALAFLRGRKSVQSMFGRTTDLHTEAKRTRDRRFIELLGWFAAELAPRLGARAPFYSADIMDRIRSGRYVSTEVFLPARVDGKGIEVPYVLSPHWRY